MKSTVLAASVTTMLVLTIVSQFGCQPTATPEPNRASAANASPSPEKVDTAAIESELMRIENDWPRVVKERDAAAVRRVEAEDVFVVYPDGNVGTQADDIRDMETGALSADSWELKDLKVTVLNKDAAFVSGYGIIKGGKYKMPNGKVNDISGEYRFIDTFARRNGEWKLVAGASVPVKQPGATSTGSSAAKGTSGEAPPAPAKSSPATKP